MFRSRPLRVAATVERLVAGEFARHDPVWPGQLALLVAISLNFTLPERLTVGPTWMLPGVEAVAVVGLITMTPHRNLTHSTWRRGFSLALIALVTATYLVSLWLDVHYLLNGGKAGGHALILAGVALWLSNVLLFAVWYWLFDRSGPVPRPGVDVRPDFLFPHMTDEVHALYPLWRPNFVDYLFLSVTNASAFSPTDTLPLTRWAKLAMAIQSISALVTVGLVVARAVNILS